MEYSEYEYTNANTLLAAMLASYSVSIGIVWYNYKIEKAVSISQIICKNKISVVCSMLVMAVPTCMYEYQRLKHAYNQEDAYWCSCGFACIITLLGSIFSLVLFDETYLIHYVFATIGFCAIMGFTFAHFILIQTPICAAVVATQFASCAYIMHRHGSNGDIFWGESTFIFAFFVFYLYLHWNWNLNYNTQSMLDNAAICSSVSEVGNSMENRIFNAPLSL